VQVPAITVRAAYSSLPNLLLLPLPLLLKAILILKKTGLLPLIAHEGFIESITLLGAFLFYAVAEKEGPFKDTGSPPHSRSTPS
jgi:hypothetical protein